MSSVLYLNCYHLDSFYTNNLEGEYPGPEWVCWKGLREFSASEYLLCEVNLLCDVPGCRLLHLSCIQPRDFSNSVILKVLEI